MAHRRLESDWDRTALLAAITINVNRDPKKSRSVSPESLNPYRAKSAPTVIPADITELKRFVGR
jgi:hypothetical protein